MIYQASDLNQRGRSILEAARAGEARLRDKDGFGLVMVPQARLDALTTVARAAASLAALERVLSTAAPLDITAYGDWTWLRVFDTEDLQEFVQDLRAALIVAGREESAAPIDETLRRWRITAESLADPLRRGVLLGPHQEADFVEVHRPE